MPLLRRHFRELLSVWEHHTRSWPARKVHTLAPAPGAEAGRPLCCEETDFTAEDAEGAEEMNNRLVTGLQRSGCALVPIFCRRPVKRRQRSRPRAIRIVRPSPWSQP